MSDSPPITDAKAPLYQRMFPFLFRRRKAEIGSQVVVDDGAVKPYYEVWFDGSDGKHKWWYAAYDANGKCIEKDYWFSEDSTHHHAKSVLKSIEKAAEAKRLGKTAPKRYYT